MLKDNTATLRHQPDHLFTHKSILFSALFLLTPGIGSSNASLNDLVPLSRQVGWLPHQHDKSANMNLGTLGWYGWLAGMDV
eukprot:4145817-Heterocapsa_arctica.AAC.1